MKKDIYFKGHITIINNDLETTTSKDIIYRLINFNNMFFFAEEISTGCIFPTYSFASIEDKTNRDMRFRSYSFIKNCKYFVFVALTNNENIFEYSLNEGSMKSNDVTSPSKREVKAYLKEKEKDSEWKSEMQKMEKHNKYMCDLSTIKEKIITLKEGEALEAPSGKFEPTYEIYTPSIELSEIEDFGFNLSTRRDLCNLIGREEEKKKIIKATCINKDSILLIGDSGSGKTAIVEGLAQDIKTNSNEWLEGKTIFYLETYSLEADTKFRGTFEDKIKKVIDFCQKHEEKIILFIDEIHTLYGLGRTEERAIDAMNILKPYISSGQIIIIGATTKIEYEKYMANDPAFLRRFELLEVSSPDLEMNINIIISYIKELEEIHSIKLELDEQEKHGVAEYITTLADYENQRTSRIDITTSKSIIKDAFAEAIYNKSTSVKLEDICFAIISCNKLSPSFRKAKAEELKSKLQTMSLENNPYTRTKTIN